MEIAVIGIGPGNKYGMTLQAEKALQKAQVILGAKRMLESLPEEYTQNRIEAIAPQAMVDFLQTNGEYQKAGIVLSGDVGFYSGAKKLLPLLTGHEVELISGVSSPQILAERLKRPWQGFKLVSAHGVDCNVLGQVLNHPEVFFLTGNTITPQDICSVLVQAGLDEAKVTVGENLSYPEERVITGTAFELAKETFAPLSVVLVENHKTFHPDFYAAGIGDEEFIRGKVPMTKREVRAVALALLAPKPQEILYDVGAGTGSIAIELSLQARWGQVYAIEKKPEACQLIHQNKEKFGTYNLQIVPGEAPEALDALPAPQGVFIGGSTGNMGNILGLLLKKNPRVRVVISAVTVETLAEAVKYMEELHFTQVEVTQVIASRTNSVGSYHMFAGLNPIFLISGKGEGDE